ncbi:MAG: SDR family oxidoreductase [Pseudonocardia sp.]|nr:SDR family oxidoreductase [Pseudonocardia sp.]
MTRTTAPAAPRQEDQHLHGQTVVVIGGSSGIGLETARQARSLGAEVVLTGRDPARLERAATELQPLTTAAFDATDTARLTAFFADLPAPIDHVMLTAGSPYYVPITELDFARAHRELDEHLWLPLHLARTIIGKVRPGGAMLMVSGTAARRPALGLTLPAALTAALSALTANLALELAPVRVNLIAAGFVDTPLSARLLGDDLDDRRAQLSAALPIRRVVGPADVAALALHLMTNTALTGAVYDVDGGQQLIGT